MAMTSTTVTTGAICEFRNLSACIRISYLSLTFGRTSQPTAHSAGQQMITFRSQPKNHAILSYRPTQPKPVPKNQALHNQSATDAPGISIQAV